MFIGIRTYNRKALVENCLSSLTKCSSLENSKVYIFDDRSEEIDLNWLKTAFPSAELRQWPQHLGSDESTRQIFLEFLKTEHQLLFLLDSDLILHPEALRFAEERIKKTDGVLSLFNSMLHANIDSEASFDPDLVQKKHLGDAASVFSRSVVRKLVDAFPHKTKSLDFKWSKHLSQNKIKLFAAKNSLVQHLGLDGTNSHALYEFDFGLNFRPGSRENEEFLRKFYEDFMKMHNDFARERERLIDRLILPRLLHHYKRKAYKIADKLILKK